MEFFAFLGPIVFLFWTLPIIVYIWMAVCLQTIARKTGTQDDWLAWIPIANTYLLIKIAGWSGWWIFALLVPILNIGLVIAWWWLVSEKRGKPGWLGVLMIVPPIDLIVPGVLAFSE